MTTRNSLVATTLPIAELLALEMQTSAGKTGGRVCWDKYPIFRFRVWVHTPIFGHAGAVYSWRQLCK